MKLHMRNKTWVQTLMKNMIFKLASVSLLILSSTNIVFAAPSPVHKTHAIAMNGAPKYAKGFKHFEYVNPDAPKGGFIRQQSIGSYDSFNSFIAKGQAVTGIALIYDTLLSSSSDEPFTEYGLIADEIEMPEDRSWVIFHLNPKARFNDGKTVTVKDVIFSFNTLITQGHPFYKKYYADVKKVEDLGDRRVKFYFGESTNRELPLIVGQMEVLPEHYWKNRDFTQSTLDAPLGSGPYKIGDFKAGRYVKYERVKDYWAKDLPVNKGRYNFDQIQYDYYRDGTVSLEAFKAGEYDFREENNSKLWATMYTGKNFDKGWIAKETISHELPRGMQGFAFNTRRSMFQDRKVREAIGTVFDFEWSNKNLFYGQYTRTSSYFTNSELASSGLPSSEELKILNPLKKDLPPEVFSKAFILPKNSATGNIRKELRKASRLLKEAGWVIRDKQRVHKKTGKPLSFEILLVSPAFERIVLPFKKNLKRLGIEVKVRVVDSSQYINRLRSFDFDMVVAVFGQSLSPGNEQRNYWTSASAQVAGSRNVMGIQNPAIDHLVDLVINAPDRQSLITRTHALDRALLWGHYIVPHWHLSYYRVSYWNRFSRPKITPKYAFGFLTWWIDAQKDSTLKKQRQE